MEDILCLFHSNTLLRTVEGAADLLVQHISQSELRPKTAPRTGMAICSPMSLPVSTSSIKSCGMALPLFTERTGL
jgi:hypothetical protein